MKIQPVRHMPNRDYPTMADVRTDRDLLQNVPARWGKCSGVGALLGLLAASASVRAESGGETAETAVLAAVRPETPAAEAAAGQQVSRAMAVVAPLLEEALTHDGRGSFGCVAVSPPTFMPEDEALALIREELEAAGLRLKEGVELENVPGPTQEPMEMREIKGSDGEIRVEPRRVWGSGRSLGQRTIRFDWADVDRAVYVDYLARRDHRAWKGLLGGTADYFDFPELAQEVAGAYADYSAERDTWFGVFFDPLADSGVVKVDLQGLTPEQERLADRERGNKWKTVKGEKGRERLRAQVRHFVEFLRQEGVLPPAE